jgi:hypothetical protein
MTKTGSDHFCLLHYHTYIVHDKLPKGEVVKREQFVESKRLDDQFSSYFVRLLPKINP